MEGKKFEHLEKRMCKELEILEDKYASGVEMAEVDLRRIDTLSHALKSLAAYKAMKESEEYGMEEEPEGMSGRRGRSSVTGRYVSREGGNSFTEGYSRGYSEAMSQMQNSGNGGGGGGGNSGHYPMRPWQYPNQANW